MNFTYSSKLVTSLLLATFLVTSAGVLLGYVWCVGDDGHVEVSYSSAVDCCGDDQKQRAVDQYDVPSISQTNGDPCGLCLDFSAQQGEAVFLKRTKRASSVSLDSLSPNHSLSSARQDVKLVAVNSLSQPPPRVAQAILFHRTVVLQT
jgi:hypothetical protein